MKTKIFLTAFLALVAMCLPNFASAGLPEAVNYLKSQPQDAWITMALAAAGETNVLVDHLSSITESSYPTTDYAKAILALAAAGKNPTTFGEIDYVAKLKKYYNEDQMGDVVYLNDDIWSILALASIHQIDSKEAVTAKEFLLKNQNGDGGWSYLVGGLSDSNDTAAAIMALTETGVSASDPVIVKALDYLRFLQNADGGFPYNPAWGSDSDSSSDAWVISAIYKLGQNPAEWDKSGNNPLTHLQSLQDEDGGFWWIKPDPADPEKWNSKSDTSKVIIALAGKSYPVDYYEIPKPAAKLTVDKNTFNFGESVVIKVEYFNDNDQTWLPLAGAAVQGLPENYTTNEAGQASTTLPSGDYNLSATKEGFVTSEQVKISVLAPAPAPAPAPGGSIIFTTPTYCQSVEYDVWQNTCADNWQYRNVLTVAPANCTLTAEQENQRKRTCVALEEVNNESAELKPEVLGVKIASSSAEQLDKVAAEAGSIINGQMDNFIITGTASTVKLGAGERAGVLNSYKSSFGKAPRTQAEWEDVIRISNNQLPLVTNSAAGEKAKLEFKKVYQREAEIENFNDQTAINLMAYGLRPDKRDLNLERAGIRVFAGIYEHLPVSALDWDTVRAIAYSGVGL